MLLDQSRIVSADNLTGIISLADAEGGAKVAEGGGQIVAPPSIPSGAGAIFERELRRVRNDPVIERLAMLVDRGMHAVDSFRR